MKTYYITWTEHHYAEVEEENEKAAIDAAYELDKEDTLENTVLENVECDEFDGKPDPMDLSKAHKEDQLLKDQGDSVA